MSSDKIAGKMPSDTFWYSGKRGLDQKQMREVFPLSGSLTGQFGLLKSVTRNRAFIKKQYMFLTNYSGDTGKMADIREKSGIPITVPFS
jgi:hypothetical protein